MIALLASQFYSSAGHAGSNIHELYLEAAINGLPTNVIANFHQYPDGRLAISPSELREIGLEPDPAALGPDGLIDLHRLSGVTYKYDTVKQTIHFKTLESRRVRRHFDARAGEYGGADKNYTIAERAPSAVLNYLVYGTTDSGLREFFDLDGRRGAVSAALNGSIAGQQGVLTQSGILTAASDGVQNSVRLDTTWSRDDPLALITYRAGDVISGGLNWTRPIRLGGLQMQRSFALRPDLVTMPILPLSGSAAVPSTVDVLINNVRSFSKDVPPGPFEIDNLPVASGSGTQTLVVRDALGRETVSSLPFYASSKLLRPGLSDFSLETGFPRFSYSIESYDYESNPVASASVRQGVYDWLTLEAHAEGGDGLANGGLGAVVPIGHIGVGSLALAGSNGESEQGAQITASFETNFNYATLFVRAQRSFGGYLDIASLAPDASLLSLRTPLTLRPPKELNQASMTVPLRFDTSSLNLSFTQLRDVSDNNFDIFSLSYSRPIRKNASLYLSGFKDFSSENVGVYAGFSLSLNDNISVSAGGTSGSSRPGGGVDVVKSQPLEAGTYGWRLRDHEGDVPDRLAGASYRTSFGLASASVQQSGDMARFSGEFDGAIAAVGGNVFFANHIDDSFAVVDAGAPDVDVFYENRLAGKSNSKGLLLVPYLRAYEANWFTIDPASLPIDTLVPRTKISVVPARRDGVIVDFGVSQDSAAALVTIRDAKNKFLPVGAHGHVDGGEDFVVGYDGQAFLHGLKPKNEIIVKLAGGGSCHAEFTYAGLRGVRAMIDKVVCR